MTKQDLHTLVDNLPEGCTDEAARMLVLLARDEQQAVASAAWLTADLSGFAAWEADDEVDPAEGEPIRWDASRAEFVVG
jgi:hypothetical protein